MKSTGSYFNDVIPLWISRYDYEKGWELCPHIHNDFYQLIYCISGSGTCYISNNGSSAIRDMKRYLFTADTCLLIHPGVCHAIDSIAEEGLKTLDIKFIINNKKLERRLKRIPSINKNCDSRIRDYLEIIRVEGEEQDVEYISYSQLYLSMIIIELIRMDEPVLTTNKILSNPMIYQENLSNLSIKVLAYIQNYYNQNIKASDMEAALNYSYRYLSKITTFETGLSPIELLNWFRCHIAKEKLILSDMTLTEISEYAGYSNIHQFSKAFKKLTGKPPATYRKEFLSGIRKDINFNTEFVNENHTQR